MKTITMYELLGLVKNGNAPNKIKWGNIKYTLYTDEDTKQKYYQNDECSFFFLNIKCLDDLNDEVEIIEEHEEEPTQEEINKYTNKFLEAWIPVKKQFGKLFDEIARINNNFNLEDESEEEKKIPEKINTFEELTHIPENFNFNDILLADKINEIIDCLDYLKSKGE